MKSWQQLIVAIFAGVIIYIFFGPKNSIPHNPARQGTPLQKGDRVFVFGGYFMTPAWLDGKEGYAGTVERFIPGQNEIPAAVIRTDEKVIAEGISGDVLVLSLRYADVLWQFGAIVHVELCDFEPDSTRWQDRRQGKWVEGAASIRLLME